MALFWKQEEMTAMQEHRGPYEEIKRLVGKLTPEERSRLISEILGDSSNRAVARSGENDLVSLKAMWRKYSRPMGSWNRDDIHDRGL